MSQDINEWQYPTREVSTAELDEVARSLRLAKEVYTERKAASDEAYGAVKEAEAKLISLMKDAGKTKYIAEGIGSISISTNLSVQTPKSPEQKKAFFNWVRETMGDDAYYAYMTVNSNSLNSLYRNKVEEYGARGEVLDIDGLLPPSESTKLSFRKA